MFSHLSVHLFVFVFSVCLTVIKHEISKSHGWIPMKLGGHIGNVTRKNSFGFGGYPDLDPRILK